MTANPTLDLARDILARGAKAVVSLEVFSGPEWDKAAQRAEDGDPADLHWLEAETALWERFGNYAYNGGRLEFDEWKERMA